MMITYYYCETCLPRGYFLVGYQTTELRGHIYTFGADNASGNNGYNGYSFTLRPVIGKSLSYCSDIYDTVAKKQPS